MHVLMLHHASSHAHHQSLTASRCNSAREQGCCLPGHKVRVHTFAWRATLDDLAAPALQPLGTGLPLAELARQLPHSHHPRHGSPQGIASRKVDAQAAV